MAWRKAGEIVEMLEAELILGNGSVRSGRGLTAALAKRMGEAREKHPVFAEGEYHALGVIGEEYRERIRDEDLDVAVTALRLWMGEHEEA